MAGASRAVRRRAGLAGSAAIAAAACLSAFLIAGGDTAPPRAFAVSDSIARSPSGKRYPANRAAELKARLLERPKDAAAPSWAIEYASAPELARLEAMTRAAERAWAIRIGLAAGPAGEDKTKLESLAEGLDECPLDSVAIKRAAQGLMRIGVVVPLSGRYERFGKTFVNGFRLALDEHNREWAPTLHMILHDSEGDPLVGARKSRWLLKDHGVSVLVGEIFSANTAPLAAATQVLGAILISPSATNERLATLGDGVFQLHIGAGATASALARHLAGESPHSSIGILTARTHDDSLQAAAVAAACDFAAVRVLKIERVPEDEADVTAPLQRLRALRPTALVLVGPPKLMGNVGAQLASAWPEPRARVFGFQSLDPDGLIREGRDGLEGAVIFMDDYALDGAPRDSFQMRYEKAFKDAPTRMSVRGYLSGLAIDRAVEAGCVTASQLKQSLRGQVYETPEGRTLRALRPVVPAYPERLVIRSGKAVPLEPKPVEP